MFYENQDVEKKIHDDGRSTLLLRSISSILYGGL
jgi:hypothetical protein